MVPPAWRMGVTLRWIQKALPSARRAWQSASYVSDADAAGSNDLKMRETYSTGRNESVVAPMRVAVGALSMDASRGLAFVMRRSGAMEATPCGAWSMTSFS